ncbi:hypothetical protein C8F04DRAFT_1275935 [Mycena alexandri]|uniref:Uncharacterized protein n=1 Tax=Mycena alexandri TaxID=1745969 RepID=A0AAD6WNX4_9AGAR|nr:hypothetical protein C8F04DRAFT_1275935 [Mycena alexandri]
MPPPGRLRCVPPYRPERAMRTSNEFLRNTAGSTSSAAGGLARARRQVEGVSNGHWRKAKSWDQALTIWGEECDVFHEGGCPSHHVPAARNSKITLNAEDSPCRDAATHSSKPDDAATTYTTTRVSEGQAYSMPGFTASSATPRAFPVAATRAFPAASSTPPPKISASAFTATRRALPTSGPSSPQKTSASQSTRSSPARASPSKPATHTPQSPLSNMDAVEAFSRMGISEPIVYESPPKQWVIKGVNIFFAQREEAVNYILTHQLQTPSGMVGSRNIRKLRAFARGQKYVAGPLDWEDTDDE